MGCRQRVRTYSRFSCGHRQYHHTYFRPSTLAPPITTTPVHVLSNAHMLTHFSIRVLVTHPHLHDLHHPTTPPPPWSIGEARESAGVGASMTWLDESFCWPFFTIFAHPLSVCVCACMFFVFFFNITKKKKIQQKMGKNSSMIPRGRGFHQPFLVFISAMGCMTPAPPFHSLHSLCLPLCIEPRENFQTPAQNR